MSDDNALDQSEVEKLLAGLAGGSPAPQTPPEQAMPASSPGGADPNAALDQSEVEALLHGRKPAGGQEPSSPPPQVPPISASADDGDKQLRQSQIESLLNGGGTAVPPVGGNIAGLGKSDAMVEESHDDSVPHGDIDYLLKRAEEALESITTTSPASRSHLPPEVIEFQFPEFGGTTPNSEHATLDQISEVELDLKVELGRTNMYLEDVLKLRKGSVVALDKIAGDAVDIYVNGRLIARGEVLVMNDNFCVRVAELLAGAIPIE